MPCPHSPLLCHKSLRSGIANAELCSWAASKMRGAICLVSAGFPNGVAIVSKPFANPNFRVKYEMNIYEYMCAWYHLISFFFFLKLREKESAQYFISSQVPNWKKHNKQIKPTIRSISNKQLDN